MCAQCGQEYYTDASSLEEALEHPGLSVSVNRKGDVCGILKMGEVSSGVHKLDHSATRQMIEVAQQKARELHVALDAYIPSDQL